MSDIDEGPEGNIGVNVFAVVGCLVCAGLASGLTQGLLSLDVLDLTIKKRSGNELEKKYATALLPIIEQHHLLLVSLMLWNATAMETLPLYLDKLVPEVVAIVLSVTLILLVGEIGPAAVMTGPKQLQIAYSLSTLVYVVLFVFFPIAWPIGKFLDWLLGHDEKIMRYNRLELSELVKIQHEATKQRKERGHTVDSVESNAVDIDEVNMISGVLKFTDATVKDVMSTDVFMLSMNDKLNFQTMNKIFKSGYSRIPVYERDRQDVVGIMLTKDLLFIDPDDESPIRSFMSLFSRPIATVWPDQRLGEVLKEFRSSCRHCAIVRDVKDMGDLDPVYVISGIITLEDIFERILGTEFMDETDYLESETAKAYKERTDFELMRMRLLNPSLLGQDKALQLGDAEREAVISYLQASVPQITSICGKGNFEATQKLVDDSILVEAERVGGEDQMHTENVLYRRGKPTNTCILILTGKILVMAGKENFRIEMGPWSMFGADVLTLPEDQYVPDFTAAIMSSEVRYLRINKPSSGESTQNVGLIGVSHAMMRRMSYKKGPDDVGDGDRMRGLSEDESDALLKPPSLPHTPSASSRASTTAVMQETDNPLHRPPPHRLSDVVQFQEPLLETTSNPIHFDTDSADNV